MPRIVEALAARPRHAVPLRPAGTGKTALAEHIAAALQRPLMIRQASDLMSKFVGETEQNMARMFEEAAGRAVPCCCWTRPTASCAAAAMAERNYEVQRVNEMLQGMERHAGVFICTTNLFEELDAAALRRFTFKIRFHEAADAAQRERMFVAEALGGDARAHREQSQAPRALELLVPGDFAAGRRVECWAEFEPDAFLAQLEAEHRVKPEVRGRRGMGSCVSPSCRRDACQRPRARQTARCPLSGLITWTRDLEPPSSPGIGLQCCHGIRRLAALIWPGTLSSTLSR